MLMPLWQLVLLALALSFVYPQGGYVFLPYLGYGLMVLIFFGALKLEFRQFYVIKKQWGKILTVFAVMHLLSALLLWLFIGFFSTEIISGFIIAAVVPCGMATIFFTQYFGGHVAVAVVLTVIGNLLSPLSIPLLYDVFLRLFQLPQSKVIRLDFVQVSITVAVMVLLPIVVAVIVRRLFKNIEILYKINRYFSAILMLIMSYGMIGPAVLYSQKTPFLSLKILAVVMAMVAVQTLAGWLVCKQKNLQIAYMLGSGYKNFTLAMILASSFISLDAALPAIMYSVINNASLAVMEYFFVLRKNWQ